jgi:hypothetical protein
MFGDMIDFFVTNPGGACVPCFPGDVSLNEMALFSKSKSRLSKKGRQYARPQGRASKGSQARTPARISSASELLGSRAKLTFDWPGGRDSRTREKDPMNNHPKNPE